MASMSSSSGWNRTNQGVIRGLNVPNRIEIRVDGMRVGQFTLGGGPELRQPRAGRRRQTITGKALLQYSPMTRCRCASR